MMPASARTVQRTLLPVLLLKGENIALGMQIGERGLALHLSTWWGLILYSTPHSCELNYYLNTCDHLNPFRVT